MLYLLLLGSVWLCMCSNAAAILVCGAVGVAYVCVLVLFGMAFVLGRGWLVTEIVLL